MTPAERLQHIADQNAGTAHAIRFTEPHEAQTLTRLARELREIARHLPPERGQA